ncbi:hypothetical protein H6504_01025 [Candidatus Woesearchaeota archaeon]|nr:hypothetical protein [Candidatus Woesearchaeota archaeon]
MDGAQPPRVQILSDERIFLNNATGEQGVLLGELEGESSLLIRLDNGCYLFDDYCRYSRDMRPWFYVNNYTKRHELDGLTVDDRISSGVLENLVTLEYGPWRQEWFAIHKMPEPYNLNRRIPILVEEADIDGQLWYRAFNPELSRVLNEEGIANSPQDAIDVLADSLARLLDDCYLYDSRVHSSLLKLFNKYIAPLEYPEAYREELADMHRSMQAYDLYEETIMPKGAKTAVPVVVFSQDQTGMFGVLAKHEGVYVEGSSLPEIEHLFQSLFTYQFEDLFHLEGKTKAQVRRLKMLEAYYK